MQQQQQELSALREELSNRLERIENKLDAFTVAAGKAETDINWLKGYIKISTSLFLTIVTSLVGFLITGKLG